MELTSSEFAILLNLQRDVLLVILGLTILMILTSYIAPKIVFILYERNTIPGIQDVIKKLIYKLDEYADEMSNLEKRRITAEKINDLVSFNGIRIPKFICGWIVDIQVKRIRELQKKCSKDTDLHR